jgi:hypothetical protein
MFPFNCAPSDPAVKKQSRFMDRRFKWFIFKHYVLILFVLALLAFSWFILISARQRDDFNLLLVMLGGLVSFFYFIQKQQLEELQSFRELFQYFNKKYDGLNEILNGIATGDVNKALTEDEEDALNDYFNLCSEEYLYYIKGFIYPEVWIAWCNGMEYFLQHKRIGELWKKEEEKSASYYGLTRREIRKHVSRK